MTDVDKRQHIRHYIEDAAPGTIMQPSQICEECGVSERKLMEEVVIACITEDIITPVYITDEDQNWTPDLLKYVGIPPEKIFVAFKRLGYGEVRNIHRKEQ